MRENRVRHALHVLLALLGGCSDVTPAKVELEGSYTLESADGRVPPAPAALGCQVTASVLALLGERQFTLHDTLVCPPGESGGVVPTGAFQTGTYSATSDIVTLHFDRFVNGSFFLIAPEYVSAEWRSATLVVQTTFYGVATPQRRVYRRQ